MKIKLIFASVCAPFRVGPRARNRSAAQNPARNSPHDDGERRGFFIPRASSSRLYRRNYTARAIIARNQPTRFAERLHPVCVCVYEGIAARTTTSDTEELRGDENETSRTGSHTVVVVVDFSLRSCIKSFLFCRMYARGTYAKERRISGAVIVSRAGARAVSALSRAVQPVHRR